MSGGVGFADPEERVVIEEEGAPLGIYTSRHSLPGRDIAFAATTATLAVAAVSPRLWDYIGEQAAWHVKRFPEAHRVLGPYEEIFGPLLDSLQTHRRDPLDSSGWAPLPVALDRAHEHLASFFAPDTPGGAWLAPLQPGTDYDVLTTAFQEPWIIAAQSPPKGWSITGLGAEAVVIVGLGQTGDPALLFAGVFGVTVARIVREPAEAMGERFAAWVREVGRD